MAHPLINGDFYNAILHFEESDEAQEYYYKVMNSVVERNGEQHTVTISVRWRGRLPALKT